MCNGCNKNYDEESIEQHLREYIEKYPDKMESIEGMIGAMFLQVRDELRYSEISLRSRESRIEKLEKELKSAIKGKWKYYANKIHAGRNN